MSSIETFCPPPLRVRLLPLVRKVARTGSATPTPEQDPPSTAAKTDPVDHGGNLDSGGDSSMLDRMKDAAAVTACAARDLASAARGSVTAKGLWQEQRTFVLPLPGDDSDAAAQGVCLRRSVHWGPTI